MAAGRAAAAAAATPARPPCPQKTQRPQPPVGRALLALLLGLLTGRLLAYAPGTTQAAAAAQPDPWHPSAYSPSPHARCTPPPHVRSRAASPPASPHCARITALSATALSASLRIVAPAAAAPSPGPATSLSVEVSVSAAGRVLGAPRGARVVALIGASGVLTYTADGLLPDADYVLVAALVGGLAARRTAVCRVTFSTPPAAAGGGELVRNGGFEQRGDAPHVATRFRTGDGGGARAWTPFYNGGMRLVCGLVATSVNGGGGDAALLQPRSGRCCAQFGPGDGAEGGGEAAAPRKFYGAHQAVPVPAGISAVRVAAWYRVTPGTALGGPPPGGESPADSLAMAVGWQLDDGGLVDPLVFDLSGVSSAGSEGEDGWRLVCAVVRAPGDATGLRMVHVYFHFHDRPAGALFVDDVSVTPARAGAATDADCHTHSDYSAPGSSSSPVGAPPPPTVHLKAAVRPHGRQLTLAVPLTGDRVLRLETLSRMYGGGPVAAAVLVRDEEEASMFVHIWRRMPWLHMHVDVTLVHMSRARVAAELLPINALRNTAVRLARTEFTLMLDVDMTPATESFACLRDPDGSFLSGLLPRDGDDVRIFTAPVFITDVHARAPPSKDALLNMLYHRAATAYCANSQKAAKIDRWYAAGAPYETRFATDYEPYGVCRRERHPEYDERFVGYGFNKVAWAWAAEAGGARLFVLSDSFVTHLNHVDNEWVSHIGVPQYLRTWRRYFAFVAEAVAIHGAPPAARYVPAYGPELRGT